MTFHVILASRKTVQKRKPTSYVTDDCAYCSKYINTMIHGFFVSVTYQSSWHHSFSHLAGIEHSPLVSALDQSTVEETAAAAAAVGESLCQKVAALLLLLPLIRTLFLNNFLTGCWRPAIISVYENVRSKCSIYVFLVSKLDFNPTGKQISVGHNKLHSL